MWNEQNSKNNWLPQADPREYAKIVERGEEGISEVDPHAEIVLGGMYGYPRDPKSMKAAKFLGKFYKEPGIAKHFDAINSHPYGSGVGDVKSQINDLRSAAKKAGDGNVGLYVGELGWASSGPSSSESVVGEKGQADRLKGGLNLLVKKQNAWNVGGVFVYAWKDFPAGQTRLPVVSRRRPRQGERQGKAGARRGQEGNPQEGLIASCRGRSGT